MHNTDNTALEDNRQVDNPACPNELMKLSLIGDEYFLTDYMGIPFDLDFVKSVIDSLLNWYDGRTKKDCESARRHAVAIQYPHMYPQLYGEPLPPEYKAYQEYVKTEQEKRQLLAECKIVPGYVYLLRAGDYYKIGLTRDTVKKRAAQIQRTMPYQINIVHQINTEFPGQLEDQLHKRFADKRIAGEWFDLLPDDIDYIQSIGDDA